MRYLLIIGLSLLAMKFKAQTYADIQETDSLPKRVVFYLPTADNAKLNVIKNEFIKYAQIESAVYVYQNHKALLIEFATVASPKFYTYADIKKQIAQGVSHEEIFIKTPLAFDEIINGSSEESTTFILK